MKNRRASRGATLVEFALVLPLFMFLVITIMDFGRAYMTYQTMTNAAREGARYAVAPTPNTVTLPSTSAVTTQVCDYLSAGGVTCGSGAGKAVVSVTPTTAMFNGVSTAYTNVSITYNGFQFLYLTSINFSTSSVMRNETSN